MVEHPMRLNYYNKIWVTGNNAKGLKIFRLITVVFCLLFNSSFNDSHTSLADDDSHYGPSAFYGKGQVNNIFKTKLSDKGKDDITLELPQQGSYSERAEARRSKEEQALADRLRRLGITNPQNDNVSNDYAVKQKTSEKENKLSSSSPFAPRELTAQEKMMQQPRTNFNGENSTEQGELSLSDKLAAKYGGPNDRPSLRPDKNAPDSYKAVADALEAGDEKTAYEYARRYVEQKNDIMEAVNLLVRFEGFYNDRKNGMGLNELAEKYPDLKNSALLVETEEEEARESEQTKYETTLNEESKKIIESMKKNSHEMFKQPKSTNSLAANLNEKDERIKAQQILEKRHIPHAPGGKIDLYAFIKLRDDDNRAIAGDLEKLYQTSLKSNNQISFVAVTGGSFDERDLSDFRRETKTTFPVTAGITLAKAMGVSIYPTVVFVASQSAEQYMEKGLRNFYYYDEVLNFMRR